MAHPLMIEQLLKLIVAVRNVAENDPLAVASNPNTKLLVALSQLIFEEIPADPQNSKFRQGETLGKEHKHWFRAKFGNGRFRLFFRFSTTHRTLIFSWVNDEQSLRTYGSRTDAYKDFKGMLDSGRPPGDWKKLMAECEAQTGLDLLQGEISKMVGKE